MAERMIGGILWEEDEKPDVEATETLAGADALAAAVAAKLSGNDPGVARDWLCAMWALLAGCPSIVGYPSRPPHSS
jgi:hypothetical protein